MHDAARDTVARPSRSLPEDPELETLRKTSGVFSLGIGVVALPIATIVYALFAYLAITLSTACVGASSWICAVGPMVLGPFCALLAAIALLALVVSLGTLVFSGAALVRDRFVFFVVTLTSGSVLSATGLSCVVAYFVLPPADSMGSAELGAHLVAIAVAAPTLACGVACLIGAAFRGLKVAIE